MKKPIHHALGRREREVMDVVFRRGEATVADVVAEVGESVYDSVRVTLRNLEKKGYLTHRQEDQHYVYRPTIRRETARRSAMSHLLRTFFDDSPSSAILAFLEMGEPRISDEELEAIAARIDEAAREESDREARDRTAREASGPDGSGPDR
ncbi:MAG TPA: BlaI/MecI/CopY family transcriptional regulator [Longimicrobiales bacterium]|nr:BlaI/MecI/CopY family transcriptional regulator [Longimicrobiales bacterium]